MPRNARATMSRISVTGYGTPSLADTSGTDNTKALGGDVCDATLLSTGGRNLTLDGIVVRLNITLIIVFGGMSDQLDRAEDDLRSLEVFVASLRLGLVECPPEIASVVAGIVARACREVDEVVSNSN